MDLRTALLTKFYTVLTADSTLQSAMGGTVNMSPGWCPADGPWPYLVHKIDLRPTDFWPIVEATYTQHIFSADGSYAEIHAIRDRLITLLDQQVWDIDDGAGNTVATGARIFYAGDDDNVEQTNQVRHGVILWNIRLYRTGEVSNILSR